MYSTSALYDPPARDNEPPAIPVINARFGGWRLTLARQPLDDAATAARYDRLAPRWAQLTAPLNPEAAYEAVIRQILPRVPRDADGTFRALDCGVGAGAVPLALARTSCGEANISAVDLSPAMLEAARKRLNSEGASISTRLAAIEALPYADCSFDFVSCAHALEHLADPLAGLREMIRVLRPGGVALASLTRRSLAGRYIQARWPAHVHDRRSARMLAKAGGLRRIRLLEAPGAPAFNGFSIVVAGEKPDEAGESRRA